MRFEHDIYDVDVYSLCESVYYSCNNDEYDYVLECVNDWIYNGYIFTEVTDAYLAKILGDDNFITDYDRFYSILPGVKPKPEYEDWRNSGVSNSKDPIRRDLINALLAFRKARKIYNTGVADLQKNIEQVKKIDQDDELVSKLERNSDDDARALNTSIDNYVKARTRYRSKYGKAPTGQNVEIVRDKLPLGLDNNIYSWQSEETPPPKEEPLSDPLGDNKGKPAQPKPSTGGENGTPPSPHNNTPPNPPVVNTPSRLSRATTWMKNNKVKGGLGVVAAGAAIGGGIYAYKQYKNRPKSVIAKRIQALRGIYHKFMINAQRNPKKANIFKRIAAKILSVIDKLLHYLQNKADGR